MSGRPREEAARGARPRAGRGRASGGGRGIPRPPAGVLALLAECQGSAGPGCRAGPESWARPALLRSSQLPAPAVETAPPPDPGRRTISQTSRRGWLAPQGPAPFAPGTDPPLPAPHCLPRCGTLPSHTAPPPPTSLIGGPTRGNSKLSVGPSFPGPVPTPLRTPFPGIDPPRPPFHFTS